MTPSSNTPVRALADQAPWRGSALDRHRWAALAGALAVYGLLALVAYWPVLPGSDSRMPFCACGDPAQQTWFLAWLPYALAHGHNPLLSAWTNYPYGANLAQNTAMPLLALLTAPLTVLVSPIASYNLLIWLAFPASAGAMFVVLRRWTGSAPAAFAGGLVYGFSAYMVTQGVGHVFLLFVPLPPVILYQLHKLVATRGGSPYRKGVGLGLLGAAQFLISTEVAATWAVFCAIALALVAIARWRSITAAQAARVARGLGTGLAVAAVVVGYPAWLMLFGPDHLRAPVHAIDNPWHNGLFSAFLPDSTTRRSLDTLTRLARWLGGGNSSSNPAFLGIPLVLLAVVLTIRYRRRPWIALSAAMTVIAYLLSLGPWLIVDGRRTVIRLPFDLLAHVPLLDNALPDRLSLYTALFTAVTVGLGVAYLLTERSGTADERVDPLALGWVIATAPSGLPPRRATRLGTRRTCWVASLLGFLAVVTLLPRWPYHSHPSAVPSFFETASLVERIPAGGVVLTFPYPEYPVNQAMLWQAVGGMRFKELGTYAVWATAAGEPGLLSPSLSPHPLEQYLLCEDSIVAPHIRFAATTVNGEFFDAARTFLVRYHVAAVLVDRASAGARSVVVTLSRLLGPPQRLGGVDAWLQVATRLHRPTLAAVRTADPGRKRSPGAPTESAAGPALRPARSRLAPVSGCPLPARPITEHAPATASPRPSPA